MSIILKIRNLSKTYGYRPILKSLDYDVLTNQINIITGDNGTGKSTLLDVICGVTGFNAGALWFNDAPVDSPRDYLPCVSYLSSKLFLYEDLSIVRNIHFFCGLKIGKSPTENEIRRFFSVFKLNPFLTFPVKKLSTGMAKKTALGCVFMQRPSLMVLDEPYASLDVGACRILTELIAAFMDNGGTIVMTTHQDIPPFSATLSERRLKNGRLSKHIVE